MYTLHGEENSRWEFCICGYACREYNYETARLKTSYVELVITCRNNNISCCERRIKNGMYVKTKK